MSESKNLKVHAEFGDNKLDFEGTPEAVFSVFIDFLNKIYPEYEILRDIIFTPDLRAVINNLKGILQIAPEGIILTSPKDISAEDAICLALMGSYISNKFQKQPKESLSANELSKITGKAMKTMFNQLAWMVNDGIVDRVGRGEYRITSMGIKKTEEILKQLKNKKGE